MDQIVRAKPAAAKGVYVRNVAISSTMGPGVNIDITPTTGNRAMKRAEKGAARNRAAATSCQGSQSLYYTDFTGLNVKRMTELRRRLKRAGVDYVVIKNTLALRAVNESGLVGERAQGSNRSRCSERIQWPPRGCSPISRRSSSRSPP